jgi:hypothetical protein
MKTGYSKLKGDTIRQLADTIGKVDAELATENDCIHRRFFVDRFRPSSSRWRSYSIGTIRFRVVVCVSGVFRARSENCENPHLADSVGALNGGQPTAHPQRYRNQIRMHS